MLLLQCFKLITFVVKKNLEKNEQSIIIIGACCELNDLSVILLLEKTSGNSPLHFPIGHLPRLLSAFFLGFSNETLHDVLERV